MTTQRHKPIQYGPRWLHWRQSGLPTLLGSSRVQTQFFYNNLNAYKLYESEMENGIFCMEFNPEGSLLVAACGNKNLLLFDPLNPKLVRTVQSAHNNCVNSVKFLDSYCFATCSDDSKVALWDLRNLKRQQFQLDGHTSWVKSIDYVPESRTLVTSGFDGLVIAWDLMDVQNLTSSTSAPAHKEIFTMNGLMRTRISPDCSKLVITTSAGYMIAVHNLDISMLKDDIENFKPNLYRLMQLSQECLMPPDRSTELFRHPGKRNRLEFICDFPDDAEVVSSIEFHPEGHSILSRNTSKNEMAEWTCVHSIEENTQHDKSMHHHWKLPNRVHRSMTAQGLLRLLPAIPRNDLACNPSNVWEAVVAIGEARLARRQRRLPELLLNPALSRCSPGASTSQRTATDVNQRGETENLRTGYERNETFRRANNRRGNRSVSDEVVPISVFRAKSQLGNLLHRHTIAEVRIQNAIDGTGAMSSSEDDDTPAVQPRTSDEIHQNIRRLCYFIEEPNVTKGYIKEPSFSTNGRIICSPYKMGIRLLTFSSDLYLPWQCFPKTLPAALHCKLLHEFQTESDDAVVSTRFSPIDNQIAAGTRCGNIYLLSPFR